MEYSITSIENYKKYQDTGNNELLNDIHYWLEKRPAEWYGSNLDGDYRVVIAWEGGEVEARIMGVSK